MNNSNNSTNPTTSRPASDASLLRPRNRKILSEELVPGTVDGQDGRNSSFASPFASAAASPIPSTHPSRSNSSRDIPRSENTRDNGATPTRGRLGRENSLQTSNNSIAGLLGQSWTTLQEIASTVLGSDATPQEADVRRRRQSGQKHKRTSSSAPPKQWGPSCPSDARIGAGTEQGRESMVRAMKRQHLLAANGQTYSDAAGKFKRRNSDERVSSSAPPTDNNDRDALVYVVPVKASDTLAGITIKFGCSPAVLRKANRMWPNDTIQARRTIVLPVDACTVKGRPVQEPKDDGSSPTDSEATQSSSAMTSPDCWPTQGSKTNGSSFPPPPSSYSSSSETEPPWKHDSWILLPNDTTPTEIARLPRRTLGFFPPARRKSVSFSDNGTPATSIELSRSSISTNRPDGSPRHSASFSTSSGTTNRPRNTSFGTGFPLQGPGGVGTMGKNVKSPGPAQDGLNKLFASHLPNVAPPPSQSYFTPIWNPALDIADVDGSSVSTPGLGLGGSGGATAYSQANAGGSSTGGGLDIDLDKVGGAIEKWARKMASSASRILETPASSSAGGGASASSSSAAAGAHRSSSRGTSAPGSGTHPVVGVVGSGLGDLIELRDDAFEAPTESERARAQSMGWREQAQARGRSVGARGAGVAAVESGSTTRRKAGKSGKSD